MPNVKTPKETVKKQKSNNLVIDVIHQFIAITIILGLAVHELLRHIDAPQPVNYILAGVGVGFLLFLGLAPFFRRG